MALKETGNNTFIQLNTSRFSDPDAMMDIFTEIAKLSDEEAAKRLDEEATLQRIRISNADFLYLRDKKHRDEAFQQTLKEQDALFDRQRDARKKLIEQEYQDKINNLDAADEKEYAQQQARLQEELEQRLDIIDKEAELKKKNATEQAKFEYELVKKNIKKEFAEKHRQSQRDLFSPGASWDDRKKAWSSLGMRYDEETGTETRKTRALIGDLITGIADVAKKLNNQIDEIAGKKSAIDTRLQGSKNSTAFGSYWDRMSDSIVSIAGISPFVSQSAIASRISSMVEQGIAFNVEQRAVLDTIKDKIATTFDATNGTLLRLIRIQQQDTTAARLGMESALTAFLNNMYETTEYMKGLADTVKGSLEEAMSLMSGENALSFEYQVQKWLGSLYSVGMNQSSAQNLAGVIGQLAAGQLEGLTGGKASNLAIMAANRANISIADIMAKGLDESSTNRLMEAMVDYLGDIYNETKESKVVQQQYAQIFGMSASDLKAVANLASSTKNISKNGLSYDQAIGRLYDMAGSMYMRTSMGEGMKNMKENILYSMAEGIASNPILYGLNTMSNLLDTFVGGLPIPFIDTFFGGVDVHTTVADLLRAGAFSGSILSSLGKMAIGGNGGGIAPTWILDRYNLKDSNSSFVSRGTGQGLTTMKGLTYSSSGTTAVNGSGDDIVNKTLTDNQDSSNQQLANATNDQNEVTIRDVDEHVYSIFKILQDVIDGNQTFYVTSISDSEPILH